MIKNVLNKPILILLAIIICLSMLRLGFWQLDRAEQKRMLQQQLRTQSQTPPIDLSTLLEQDRNQSSLRYHPVKVTGHYQEHGSIFIDNQVLNSKVGYWLLTPLLITDSDQVILVNRGWLPAGQTRDQLPIYSTTTEMISIVGRLNKLPSKPALWKEQYKVDQGKLWQFLPIQYYTQKMHLNALPLMLELAPELDGVGGYLRQWPDLNDERVAKHQAYAFQWFAMALAFFIACLVLLVRVTRDD